MSLRVLEILAHRRGCRTWQSTDMFPGPPFPPKSTDIQHEQQQQQQQQQQQEKQQLQQQQKK